MSKSALATTHDNDDQLDVILQQFQTAMYALQMQDIQSSEQAFVKAKMVFNNLNAKGDTKEIHLSRILIGFIQTTSLFLKSSLFQTDERFKKAMEELVAAKQICEDVDASFGHFDPEEFENADLTVLPTLKLLFDFFEHVIVVMHGLVQKSLEMKEGKYVNEVEINRLAAMALRNFEYDHKYVNNSETRDLVTGLIGMINRIADTYEKKAERLEETRKVIQFIKPIDKKIFIVHGHNEGILLELKAMLENNFKIDPIILREEQDRGKTVIEKIEEYGRLCAFAFVIVTPDDIVENKKKKSFQARPNVLFELGWFCGRYGRSNVRILRQKNTPLPSDLSGLVTVDFTDKLEEVYLRIKNDLETMGILTDPKAVLSN